MPTGDVPIRTRSSRGATKLSEYYNDREKLLYGKLSMAEFEAKWRDVRIAGKQVFAAAAAILEMSDADVLKMENLYASVGGEQCWGEKEKPSFVTPASKCVHRGKSVPSALKATTFLDEDTNPTGL